MLKFRTVAIAQYTLLPTLRVHSMVHPTTLRRVHGMVQPTTLLQVHSVVQPTTDQQRGTPYYPTSRVHSMIHPTSRVHSMVHPTTLLRVHSMVHPTSSAVWGRKPTFIPPIEVTNFGIRKNTEINTMSDLWNSLSQIQQLLYI